jgi:hypothetical protein
MTAEDHAAFDLLPDPITIYRGASCKHVRGMAWTTEEKLAIWFRERVLFLGDAYVLMATVPKQKLLAYFTGRSEAEAVLDPRRLRFSIQSGAPTGLYEDHDRHS